jgi:hypothetical protein
MSLCVEPELPPDRQNGDVGRVALIIVEAPAPYPRRFAISSAVAAVAAQKAGCCVFIFDYIEYVSFDKQLR